VILGPVASSFNGQAGSAILPVTNISFTNCDFGTVRHAGQPVFLHHAQNVVLTNVTINGKTVNETLSK
jgi:cobalamin-dependent methionine synthase I